MEELISFVAFLFSQIIFLPSYIKCTALLINKEKLNIRELIKYIILSPLSAYLLSTFIYALILSRFPRIEVIGGDTIMYGISLLYMLKYQYEISINGNNVLGLYVYISYFLFQTSFSYVFDSILYDVLIQIIFALVLSIAFYKIVQRYISSIDKKKLKLTKENETMLLIPFSTAVVKLIQSITYSVLVCNEMYSTETLNNFSIYNAIINYVILLMSICFTSMMFHAISRQTQLANNTEKYKKLSEQSLQAMINAIEAKDPYTKGHSLRVAEYAKMISKKMGYSDADAQNLYTMALVHDIGKIGISDVIINKPGKLNNEEYATVKKHPETGAKILQEFDTFGKIAEIALCHHERVDGKGYPRGLKGNEISEEVAIVSVADAYDAMTSKRSYRDIIPQEKVKAEIRNGIGSQFKKEPAEAMLEIISADKEFKLRQ